MEVKINKEIRNYTESMFFGLSLRQFIFSVLACGVAVGLYFLLRPRFGTETLSWVCILGAFPFAAMGFIKYNGMTAEQFVWAWIKSEFLMPKKLMFLPDNLYYETMKPTIEAYEKGLTTVRKKQIGRTPKPKKSKKKKAKRSKEVNNAENSKKSVQAGQGKVCCAEIGTECYPD
ncbi:MAG: PrgI family protein [Lachnospiraceae bacterium]|nr:PrgI family protein [Lachnospiraceae bacterium]